MSARYLRIDALQEPMDMGPDSLKRATVGFNVIALRTSSDSFILEIVELLVSAGIGEFGVNIFASSAAGIPSGDGPYLNVRETGGTSQMFIQNDVMGYSRPSAQIRVHALRYLDASAMAQQARTALVAVRNQEVVTT